MSMRWRIFFAFLIVIVVAVSALFFFVYRSTSREVSTFVESGGFLGLEKNVNALQEYYQANGNWQGAEILLSPQPSGQQGMTGSRRQGGGGPPGERPYGLRLIDIDGYVMFDQRNPETPGEHLEEEELDSALELIVNDVVVGYLLPEEGLIFPERDIENSLLERLLPSSITAMVIAGVVGLALATVMGYFLFKPINSLEEATKKLAIGDLNQRVRTDGPKEMASLASTFNYMAEELEKADLNRKNLTADIAHELRTPLAVQQANLEAMLDGVYPMSKKNIQLLLDQNRTLNLLVEDLRLLSLVNAGELTLEEKSIEVVSFLQTFLSKFKSKLNQKKIVLETEITDQKISVLTDPLRLDQILTNIMQNAIVHTPRKGNIFVSLEQEKDHLVFKFRDSGKGISTDLLPDLFDRFSKERTGNKESTGLGLAISKKLAQALGGDLQAQNVSKGGAIFSLTLPL